MSEYQYYEFLALDRPLEARQQDEVRALSTRARVNATSFVNEYHWGNFRGDPDRMMERYYDAHLYLANWGSRRIMFRFPRTLLDLDVAEQYCLNDRVAAWTADEFTVLELASEDDSGEWVEGAEGSLSAIVGVRAEIAAGDLRGLYLAWLAGYGTWERDEYAFDREHDDELEPPVPPGLATLTASQQALADFLRLDDDLLTVAATTSPPLQDATHDPRKLAGWITNLIPPEKDRLLLRVVCDHPATVRAELLRRFRGQSTPAVPPVPRRTVADLLDTAARTRAERERRAAAQRADEEARRETIRAHARECRLDELAHDEETAWARIDTMIASRKPGEYDAAVALLTELRALAERHGRSEEFTRRCATLHQRHSRKPSLIERFNRAGVGTNHDA
ncbi:MAG: hypothetical protein ACRDQV_12470 [Pseudonocardiaceae bacterium]